MPSCREAAGRVADANSSASRPRAAKCHTIHGQGGRLAPDLSNLVHRDYASVVRDITFPSFAINPDHLAYIVALKSGRTLTGVVRTENGVVNIGDNRGAVTAVPKDDIEEMQPSATSIMPEGIPKLLGPERFRDLLTFLLTPAPHMPRDAAGPRPKLRTVAEVRAALDGAPQPAEPIRPLRLVLVSGPKDHGPGEHDYPAFQNVWAELFSVADRLEVVKAWEWPDREEFQRADAMLFYQHGDWSRSGPRTLMRSSTGEVGWCTCTGQSTAANWAASLPSESGWRL